VWPCAGKGTTSTCGPGAGAGAGVGVGAASMAGQDWWYRWCRGGETTVSFSDEAPEDSDDVDAAREAKPI
jgi:hypothetical protein